MEVTGTILESQFLWGIKALGRTTQEKDLGVTFNADMKVSLKCILFYYFHYY